jgi:dolichol-phosphate mannosyltransferase
MTKTVVVVPTYNEHENLPKLIDILLNLPVPDLEILVVDDNSPDGTGKLADELGAKTGRVNVMHRAGKQGLGTAYVQGFTWAIEHDADQIVQMDADFSHDPNDVPRLLAQLKDYDVVIGSRYTKGGRLDEQWSAWRRLLSWWANRVWVGFILQTHIRDTTAGFRAWRRQTLVGMDLNRVQSNGYIFQVEMTYIALRMGYRILEVPIYFAERRIGQSKMGFAVQLEAARGVFRVRRQYHHLSPADRAPGG